MSVEEYDLRETRGRKRILLTTGGMGVPFTAKRRPKGRDREVLSLMVRELEKRNLLEAHDRKIIARESLGRAIGSAIASAFILWRLHRREKGLA